MTHESDEAFLERMIYQFSMYVHGIRGKDSDRLLALARRGAAIPDEATEEIIESGRDASVHYSVSRIYRAMIRTALEKNHESD